MRIKMEVAEPRDFNAGDGTNVVTGTVIEELCGSRAVERDDAVVALQRGKVSTLESKLTEYWLVVECAPVVFNEMRFTSLLATPRYKLKTPPLDMLREGDVLVFNAAWRKDGGKWTEESIRAAQGGEIELEGIIIAKASFIPEP
jgi:hypothetical protein